MKEQGRVGERKRVSHVWRLQRRGNHVCEGER